MSTPRRPFPFAVWTSVDDDDDIVGSTRDAVDAYVLAARDPGVRWVTVGDLPVWGPRDTLSELTRDALREAGGIEAAFARVERLMCARLQAHLEKSASQLTREFSGLTLPQAIRSRIAVHAALRCCSRRTDLAPEGRGARRCGVFHPSVPILPRKRPPLRSGD